MSAFWHFSFSNGMKRAFPILAGLTALFLSYALYEALVVAPTDQLQGDVYRIIYYHVPSGWTMFIFFAVNFVAAPCKTFKSITRPFAVMQVMMLKIT